MSERFKSTHMKFLGTAVFDRTEMLSFSRWGQDLSWNEAEGIAKYMDAYTVEQEGVIFKEGGSEVYLCIIIDGSVDIRKEDAESKKKVIATIGNGSILGEMSLIDGSPRSASAVAEQETKLLVLDKPKFELMIKEKPLLGVRVVMKIARDISLRLRQTSGKLVDYL